MALGGRRSSPDIAILGFDNAAHASNPLSSVNYPSEDLARQATARLTALNGIWDRLTPPELACIQPEIVLRVSTGRPS